MPPLVPYVSGPTTTAALDTARSEAGQLLDEKRALETRLAEQEAKVKALQLSVDGDAEELASQHAAAKAQVAELRQQLEDATTQKAEAEQAMATQQAKVAELQAVFTEKVLI